MNFENTLKNMADRIKIEKGLDKNELLTIARDIIKHNCSQKSITLEHANEVLVLNELKYYDEKEPNTNDSDDNIVYHYTDLNGLHGIFKSYLEEREHGLPVKRCTLRASEIKFLNDTEEYNHGRELLDKLDLEIVEKICRDNPRFFNGKPSGVVEYLKTRQAKSSNGQIVGLNTGMKSMPDFLSANSASTTTTACCNNMMSPSNLKDGCQDIYAICFCKDKDSKSQWQGYGKKHGVETVGIAIGFNLGNIVYCVPGSGEEINSTPMPVCYSTNEIMAHYVRCCMQYQGESGTSVVFAKPTANCFAPYCKHESFAEEKEIRLLFYRQQQTHNTTLPETYRVYYPTIKPTIDIDFVGNNKVTNIISELIVGPGHSQNMVFNHLIHMFDSAPFSYHDEEVNLTVVNSDDLVNAPKGELFKIKNKNTIHQRDYRVAYKCNNDILIIKSSIPLRED